MPVGHMPIIAGSQTSTQNMAPMSPPAAHWAIAVPSLAAGQFMSSHGGPQKQPSTSSICNGCSPATHASHGP